MIDQFQSSLGQAFESIGDLIEVDVDASSLDINVNSGRERFVGFNNHLAFSDDSYPQASSGEQSTDSSVVDPNPFFNTEDVIATLASESSDDGTVMAFGVLDLQVTGWRLEPSEDTGVLLEIFVAHANKLANIILSIIYDMEDVFGNIKEFSDSEGQSIGANRFPDIVANVGSPLLTTHSPQTGALPFVDIGIALGSTWSDNDLSLLNVVSVNDLLLNLLGEVKTSVKDAVL